MSLVKRHPLIAFFVLTYALSWIFWLPLVFLRDTIPATQGLVLLILGVIWAFYHLPLCFTGQAFRSPSLFVPFAISTIALSVILTWVYNSTGGAFFCWFCCTLRRTFL
jgi:hypothetical protein